MTTLKPTPIAPILSVIGAEIVTAHRLLIDFEHANSLAGSKTVGLKEKIQGFDLALQILNDIEHLTKVLNQQLSDETCLTHPLPMSGIRLERIRAKLSQNQFSETGPQRPAPAVDLF